ncbi:MAG: DegT/DnrJ/EryC1/StrS family aminotransferase, partial [Cyanobacteria bacterium K_DeepCast_35m_m1_288]|nr:DegT/DnrJ/EryC1/StrS family aminotransferase [Cyanobacteria bacterium K_DeepCast_35m_m1_288]
ERLCAEVLSLPIFPELSSVQQQQVIEVLQNLCGAAASRDTAAVAA